MDIARYTLKTPFKTTPCSLHKLVHVLPLLLPVNQTFGPVPHLQYTSNFLRNLSNCRKLLCYILQERQEPGWTTIPRTISELTAGLENRKVEIRAGKKSKGTKPTPHLETLVEPHHTNAEQLLQNKTKPLKIITCRTASKQACQEERSAAQAGAGLLIFPYLTTTTCQTNLSAGKTNMNYIHQ